MRITNKMLANNFLRDMNTNLNNLSTIQTQLSTGKQINKASDDPAKASKIMQIYSDIDANKQYNTNITSTTNWLDMTDTALGQVGDVATRIQELLVSAGNAGYGADEKSAMKDEINQKVGELSQILNTNFDGKYIFGGTSGTTKPTSSAVDEDSNTQLALTGAPGSTSKLSVEVSQGVTMGYNVTATDVTDFAKAPATETDPATITDLKSLLADITTNLGTDTSDSTTKLTNTDLTGIKAFMTNVLKLRSEVGAKQNAMTSAQSRNVDQNTNMTTILSTTEDIDITQKAMEYATAQTVYTASLQTSAKVLQPSLLDYL